LALVTQIMEKFLSIAGRDKVDHSMSEKANILQNYLVNSQLSIK